MIPGICPFDVKIQRQSSVAPNLVNLQKSLHAPNLLNLNFTSNPFRLERDCFVKNAKSVSFKGFSCSTSNFAPRNLEDIPCASCGEKTLPNWQIENFAKGVKNQKGDELIASLNNKREYYREAEVRIVDLLTTMATQNPDKNLKQLVEISRPLHEENLKQMQYGILDNMKTMLKEENFSKEDTKAITDFIQTSESLIEYPTDEQYFKRKKFIEKLKRLKDCVADRNKLDKIIEYAEKLPTSTDNISAFFVKYSRRSSSEIASRLLTSALATTEHIHPQSKGGEDNTENYMVMCAKCNSQRSSMPYSEWMKFQPNMSENFEIYLQEIIRRIESGELDEQYASYPEEVCATVKKETDGVICCTVENDDATNTCTVRNASTTRPQSAKLSPEEKFQDDFAKAKADFDQKTLHLKELNEMKAEFAKDPLYLKLKERFMLIEEIRVLDIEKSKAKKELDLAQDAKSRPKRAAKTAKKGDLTVLTQKKALEQFEAVTRKLENAQKRNRQLAAEIGMPRELKKQEHELEMELKANPNPLTEKKLNDLHARKVQVQLRLNHLEIDTEILIARAELDAARIKYSNMQKVLDATNMSFEPKPFELEPVAAYVMG